MPESIQKEDWERFRALGSVPPSIREVVLRSWVRSQEDKQLGARNFAPSVAQEELRTIRRRNARLRQAAQSVLERAGYMLNDSGAMLLLCDDRGVVMEATGDSRMLARGQENHLQPGGRWDERAIGTNAIGTALHMGKPITISGVEHFCEAIQRWSCAAAPVRCPASGEVLGAVDISGASGELSGPVSALSVTLALQIEEVMRGNGLREHQRLMASFLSGRSHWGGDEILLLDGHGQPVWSSTAFDRAAEEATGGVGDVTRLIAPGEGDARAMAEQMRVLLPEAGVDIVGPPGEAQGVVVTLKRSTHRRGTPLSSGRAVTLSDIAATGPQMAEICDKAGRFVERGMPLLIEGAPGTGKETLAQALHAAGAQARRPFMIVDCSLLEPDMLRADQAAGTGFMQLAETGGTLCLDEPGQTPAGVQALLAQALAALARERPAVQVMSLSAATLSECLRSGELRGDLHFRLSAAKLALPALSERRADIPGLLRQLSESCARARQDKALRFTPKAIMRLQAHPWPGNIRELRNLVETLSAISLNRLIDVPDLPPEITAPTGEKRDDTLRQRERSAILDALADAGGNITKAARQLGISRSTLYLKLDQYGLPRGRRN